MIFRNGNIDSLNQVLFIKLDSLSNRRKDDKWVGYFNQNVKVFKRISEKLLFYKKLISVFESY